VYTGASLLDGCRQLAVYPPNHNKAVLTRRLAVLTDLVCRWWCIACWVEHVVHHVTTRSQVPGCQWLDIRGWLQSCPTLWQHYEVIPWCQQALYNTQHWYIDRQTNCPRSTLPRPRALYSAARLAAQARSWWRRDINNVILRPSVNTQPVTNRKPWPVTLTFNPIWAKLIHTHTNSSWKATQLS